MDASQRFELAGEAANLLEERGFVAVARKRGDEVLLEFWKVVAGEQRMKRFEVLGTPKDAASLADACERAFDPI